MYAMILAAGKGERMRPLTLTMPKPLLEAGGKPLLQYHIEALARACITTVVINTGRFGNMIEARFGDGSAFGLTIRYSHEGDEPLGTGGGIRKALPLLGPEPFILINGDVWTDFDYASLPTRLAGLAHLIMVGNPPHNEGGDFSVVGTSITPDGHILCTYSGIGVYQPGLFVSDNEFFSFVPLLKKAIADNQVSGEVYRGRWFDIGTPQRLAALDQLLQQSGG